MKQQISRDFSLEELEHDRWPVPSGEVTRLVATVHTLRRKPLVALTVEDLRVLIRQDVGLVHVLPLAFEVLREHPMAEGDLYEGDLLSAVLTRRPEIWKASPELARDLLLIVSELAEPSPVRQEASEFLALFAADGSDFGA